MRPFAILMFLAFITVAASGQSTLREIDLRVNGIGSETSYTTVVRKLGNPLRRYMLKFKASEACSGSPETHLTLIYSGLSITLLGDGRGRHLAVSRFEVTSKKWVASGIRIGADFETVRTKFGKPNEIEGNSIDTIMYYVTIGNLGGVNFYFRNDKLVKILMSDTLC